MAALANVDGDASVVGSHDVDTDVFGLAAGAGWRLGDVAFGAALGGGHANFDLDGGLGSGDEGLFNAGIHGRAEFGAAYLLGALAYGYHDVSTSRVVGADTLEANYGAHSFSGRAEAGYRFDTPVAGLAPYLAFQGTASASPPTARRRRAPEPSRSIMTAAPRPRRAASSASASTRRSCSTMRC